MVIVQFRSLREVARLKNEKASLIAEITTRNAIELFTFPDRG